MTTEPTTDRAAWLEPARADVETVNGPREDGTFDLRMAAYERTWSTHAPAMLHALEAVEALIVEVEIGDTYIGSHRKTIARDLREAIDRAREQA